jgi:peroxiredoxin
MDEERRTVYLGVGDRLPDLRLPKLDGGEYSIASLRGKYVLLYLWASW